MPLPTTMPLERSRGPLQPRQHKCCSHMKDRRINVGTRHCPGSFAVGKCRKTRHWVSGCSWVQQLSAGGFLWKMSWRFGGSDSVCSRSASRCLICSTLKGGSWSQETLFAGLFFFFMFLKGVCMQRLSERDLPTPTQPAPVNFSPYIWSVTKARSPELCPGLPRGWHGLKYLGHLPSPY